MKTRLSSIILVIFCTVIASAAQILYKVGSRTLVADLDMIVTNHYIWLGLLLYSMAAFMLIHALKSGELSILYPIIALSYVWVSLLSVRYLSEQMNPLKWLGVLTIICGVTFIGIGSQAGE